MALDALDDMAKVIEQHPEAGTELVDRIGEGGVRDVLAAREAIARAVALFEAPGGGQGDATSQP